MSQNVIKVSEKSLFGLKLVHFTSHNKTSLCRDKFSVKFNPVIWNRKSFDYLEKQIDDIWRKKKETSQVYDNKKFRFAGIDVFNDKISMKLGLTCYKDIIGTTQMENIDYWKKKGLMETNDSQLYMSDGLGVGVLAFTSDGHLILSRRAPWTGEYPGFWDRPGGHPEPDKVASIGSGSTREVCEVDVATEVWDSVILELEAEIGVERDQIEDQKLLGVIINDQLGGRPSLEFCANLKSSREDVLRSYALGIHREAAESSSIAFVSGPEVDVLVASRRTSDEELVNRLEAMAMGNYTPCLKGALALYASTR